MDRAQRIDTDIEAPYICIYITNCRSRRRYATYIDIRADIDPDADIDTDVDIDTSTEI